MVEKHLQMLLHLPVSPPPLAEARQMCAELTSHHYENFSVMSFLVPRRVRPHVQALYAYCRTVDDIGDEAPGDRERLLEYYEQELNAAYDSIPRHYVLVALQQTIHEYNLPRTPFLKLIQANRMDQQCSRYATFEDVLHYCDHSANPVGRLFLRLFGYHNETMFKQSDATCTALQLTNFWQDIARDYATGRIYVPREDMSRFKVSEEQFTHAPADERMRHLIQYEVERTRTYFAQGFPLLDRLSGRLKVEVALFSRGGLAILDKIEQQQFDTVSARPTLSRAEKVRLLVSTVMSPRSTQWIDT